jgi:hypothetical protein
MMRMYPLLKRELDLSRALASERDEEYDDD